MKAVPVLALLLAVLAPPAAKAAPDIVRIVAAEAVYGDIARQIAGPDAQVVSLMTNPAADPHLYEPGPAAARQLAGATIAIANGAGYEPWFDRLLPAGNTTVLRVSRLLGRGDGANPHLWVDPAAAPALARALTDALTARDPAHADAYRARRDTFLASLRPLDTAITSLRADLAGRRPPAVIAATEPVLGPLLDALGVGGSDPAVPLAAQNGTEPGPRALAALQADLDSRRVTALVFNAQVLSPLSRTLRDRARADHVPTVAVAETLPSGLDAQAWLMSIVAALAQACAAR